MSCILVVDDQLSIRRTIRALLEAAGHAVIEAADGLKAIEALSAACDLVITDIMMPEMDGLELVQHVKRMGSDIPVLVISGGWNNPSLDVLSVARKLGAHGVLSKSEIGTKLVSTVAEILSTRRRNRSAAP
jgi:CheY-like chemotaxis protein